MYLQYLHNIISYKCYKLQIPISNNQLQLDVSVVSVSFNLLFRIKSVQKENGIPLISHTYNIMI